MRDLTILVPSRGRPGNAERLAAAFNRTCTSNTDLAFVLDSNDPQFDEYISATNWLPFTGPISVGTEGSMVAALNDAAVNVPTTYVGFMGDDHLPRTIGWDAEFMAALEAGSRIVWGDDTIQGENFPTHVAMPTRIVDTLGWMAPPQFQHLCIDLVWKDWGVALGYSYLPEVIIEHVHPAKGAIPMDEGYARVNSGAIVQSDSQKYYDYRDGGQLAADVAALKAAGL